MANKSHLRILTIVEATTVNAVAKNVLEFHRSAKELCSADLDFPTVENLVATFIRRAEVDQAPNEFLKQARKLQIEVEIIPERRRFDLSVIPSLQNIVARNQPDLVVTHSVKSHFLLWRSRIWKDLPWIAFHHGYTTTDRKMRLYNRLDRWSLPAADRLVTVCKAFAAELTQNTGVPLDRIAVQHNSVRSRPNSTRQEVEAVRSKLGIASDETVVLSIGRLSQEKAHVDLINAFAVLCTSNRDWKGKLVIVGDGPERGWLEAVAQSKGLKEQVILAGQESDVQPYYAAADVFVLPSHSEGSPNVLLEAMAANLPIVATAVGGVPEIVENNRSALLAPTNDPEAMAGAIKRVLDDPDLAKRLSENAAALVASKYTPAQYVQSLVQIFQQAIASRQTRT